MADSDKRPYVQTRRARQSTARRTAILDAAAALLVSQPTAQVSIDGIAERADVARATVFAQFRSKGGLLAALVERMSEEGGSATLVDALQQPDPVLALEIFLHAGTLLWSSERRLYAALRVAAGQDPAVAAVLADKAAGRRQAMEILVHRLAADGRLAPGLAVAEAHDMLDMLTSFETHEHLAGAGDRSPEQIAALLCRLATAVAPAVRLTAPPQLRTEPRESVPPDPPRA